MSKWALFSLNNNFLKVASSDEKKDAMMTRVIDGHAKEITDEQFENVRRLKGDVTSDGTNVNYSARTADNWHEFSAEDTASGLRSNIEYLEKHLRKQNTDTVAESLKVKLQQILNDLEANGMSVFNDASSHASFEDWYLSNSNSPDITIHEIM